LLLLCPRHAVAQFVFLDANGDGVNDASDQLAQDGPTDVDVWFVTNENRDGSAAVCSSNPAQALTINSYEIVLEALHGRVEFGPMENRLPFGSVPVSFATYEDTTNASVYHNGWGHRTSFDPGRYIVATLRVRVLEGNPSLVFRGRSPVQPTDLTSFGTQCEGPEFNNTQTLGEQFFGAMGIGPPAAVAGGPYHGAVGQEIRLDGRASNDPDGDPLEFQWAFDDGGGASGAVVSHAWETVGTHHATLTVSSASGSDNDTAEITVAEPFRPVANAGGPYYGRPGVGVPFNGSGSFDPDGNPLGYQWTFGTGAQGSGIYPHYVYSTPGVYDVSLRVSDGQFVDVDETTATIANPVNASPVAVAGGPYEGITGRWIQFGAVGSSDPDGDDLVYNWNFGDGNLGTGIVTAHAFRDAGDYTVVLSVSDGIATSVATAPARIRPAFAARAFFEGGPGPVSLDDSDDDLVVRFEPVAGEFRATDVDPDLVVLLVSTKSAGLVEIPSVIAAIEHDDSDGNGIPEFAVRFPRDRFRDLAAAGELVGRTHLALTGGLYRGGSYVADMAATFLHGSRFAIRITPNPFNPQARITILTRTDGPVSATLFDVRGRRVRHVLRGEPMRAGRHEIVLDGRDDAGVSLASGVYFLQVRAPDGALAGRVVVAK
jgi:PKD repeat protein